MNQVIAQIVSAAVIGAVSPVATMGTIAVLTGRRRPLLDAIALPAGWTVVLVVLGYQAAGLVIRDPCPPDGVRRARC